MDPVVSLTAARHIPVARPSLGPAEAEAAKAAVESGWISQGARVEEFEKLIAESHGARFGVACCSGTTALHLALAGLGIGRGDRVVIPSLTMVAVANAVLYCEATPIFVDSNPDTGNPAGREVNRIDWRNVKAVIAADLYGVPCDDFVATVGHAAPLVRVIRDRAESHYAKSWSDFDIATFSFFANKICSTGEGGMAICRSAETADRMRSLRAHAFTPGDHFNHSELAYGYRSTEMQAAIGIVQHGRRDEFLSRRSRIACLYFEWLSRIEREVIEYPSRPYGSVWWVFPILCQSREHRDGLRAVLAADGIESRTYFQPLHRQPHLRRYADAEYPVADDLAARGMYLPLYPSMTDGDVEYVCDSVRAYFRSVRS